MANDRWATPDRIRELSRERFIPWPPTGRLPMLADFVMGCTAIALIVYAWRNRNA